jgi:hypothetical protein
LPSTSAVATSRRKPGSLIVPAETTRPSFGTGAVFSTFGDSISGP